MAYVNETKKSVGYLLQESLFFLLQEDGSKIAIALDFSYQNETKP